MTGLIPPYRTVWALAQAGRTRGYRTVFSHLGTNCRLEREGEPPVYVVWPFGEELVYLVAPFALVPEGLAERVRSLWEATPWGPAGAPGLSLVAEREGGLVALSLAWPIPRWAVFRHGAGWIVDTFARKLRLVEDWTAGADEGQEARLIRGGAA